MPGVGVADQAAGAGVAEVRTRVRADGYSEQYVVLQRERVTTSVMCFSYAGTVQAAAHTAPAGFFWIVNQLSSGVTLCLRRVNFSSQHNTVLATPTSGRIGLRRITWASGNPSGASLTGARAVTAGAPSANWSVRTANTGLTTISQGADIFSFFPVAALTAVGACPPAYEDWNPEDEGMVVLAAGEAIVCMQLDAGTTSDTRRFSVNFSVEEFTVPSV